MGTPAKQIGWSQESYLLHAVSKQLERLAGIIAASGGGGGIGNFVTLDTIQNIITEKDFTVVVGPAIVIEANIGPSATFSASSGNAVTVTANTGSGVYSTSVDGPGVEAFSTNDPGIFGYSFSSAGVFAHSLNSTALVIDSLNVANLSDLAIFNFDGVPKVRIDYQGALIASTTKTESFTVATLPFPPLSGEGTRAFVTDALAPVYLDEVVGGGAEKVPVFFNGSFWIVG